MKSCKRNGGFTLIELLCAMAIASAIVLAATSVLLLGMKINRQSADTVRYQGNTRMLLSAFEDMTSEGTVAEIHVEPDSWVIRNAEGRPLMSYREGVIATGSGLTVMEGVTASSVSLVGNQLTYMVETPEGVYESTIYCRLAVKNDSTTGDESAEFDRSVAFESVPYGRRQFLQALSTQLGSEGWTLLPDPNGQYTVKGKYYTEWYLGGTGYEGNPLWSEDTPWCACYVSWVINECRAYIDYDHDDEILTNDLPKFANVDRFLEDFVLRGTYSTAEELRDAGKLPDPGDIIFFDWHVNEVEDPEHVGVVIACETEGGITYVYTIEGNNGGKVVTCRYKIDNPQILGYGRLDWETEPQNGQ